MMWEEAKLDKKRHKEMTDSNELVIAVDLPTALVDSQSLERTRQLETKFRMVDNDGRMEKKAKSMPSKLKASFLHSGGDVKLADVADASDDDGLSEIKEDGSSGEDTRKARDKDASTRKSSSTPKKMSTLGPRRVPSERDTSPPPAAPRKCVQSSSGGKRSRAASARDSSDSGDNDAESKVAGGRPRALQPEPTVVVPYAGKLMPAPFITWKKQFAKQVLVQLGDFGAEQTSRKNPLACARKDYDLVSGDAEVKALDFKLLEEDLRETIKKLVASLPALLLGRR